MEMTVCIKDENSASYKNMLQKVAFLEGVVDPLGIPKTVRWGRGIWICWQEKLDSELNYVLSPGCILGN